MRQFPDRTDSPLPDVSRFETVQTPVPGALKKQQTIQEPTSDASRLETVQQQAFPTPASNASQFETVQQKTIQAPKEDVSRFATVQQQAFPTPASDASRLETVQQKTIQAPKEDVSRFATVQQKTIQAPEKDVSRFATVQQKTIQAPEEDVSRFATVQMSAVNVAPRARQLNVANIVLLLLPLLALGLWAVSLQHVSIQNMNDFGLISVLSPRIIAALGILVVSFVVTLQQRKVSIFLLALHIAILILMIDGTQNIIEEAPRFSIVYRHAGYTEYIMRTGTADTNLDAYFSWPIFFTISAFVTRVAGYSTILSYAGWAPLFYSLIYFGPLYMIFTTLTTNKRLVWLSILFFYLTNWIGQEYFSPQGLNIFLYMVIIAMLLKWFRVPSKAQKQEQVENQNGQKKSFKQAFLVWLKAPDEVTSMLQPWQQRGMLCCLILIFGLVVSSHQLTPFFTLLAVFVLVLFRKAVPVWLPVLMLGMVLFWLLVMARTFIAGHSSMVFGHMGDFFANLSTSTTKRASTGDMQHHIVADLRLLMTGLVWIMALLGCLKRVWQGYRDLTPILLATAGFLLIAAQSYGGEMFLRIYLFTLPFMVFFAASLFCSEALTTRRVEIFKRVVLATRPPAASSAPPRWLTAAIIIINLTLLGGFFFTRYGNELVDYYTYNEVNAVQHLYQIAPAHSLLIQPASDVPWQFENYELYTCVSLGDIVPTMTNTDVSPLVQYILNANVPAAYIIFTRGDQAELTSYDGAPPDSLARLEAVMLASGNFKQVYSNSDAQILQFIGANQGSSS